MEYALAYLAVAAAFSRKMICDAGRPNGAGEWAAWFVMSTLWPLTILWALAAEHT